MPRTGAGIAALLSMGIALSGCGSTGSSGSGGLFGTSPLDMFSSSKKVTPNDGALASAAVDPELDCPEVATRTGAATLLIGSKASEGEPNPLEVRYQGSIIRTARECHVNGNVMTMKIGIEGRVITGPAGAPGTVDIPLRIAIVQEGTNPKTIVSKFAKETVTITGSVDRQTFTHIDPAISFPLPLPARTVDQYVVYVGFDPLGAQPQRKAPVQKKKRRVRPTAKPRSS